MTKKKSSKTDLIKDLPKKNFEERKLYFLIMYFFVHGESTVIKELINVFIRKNFDISNSCYENYNQYICEYILSFFTHRSTLGDSNLKDLIGFFKLIYLSTNNFAFKYNKIEDFINFYSNVIKQVLNKNYFYVWNNTFLIKYRINRKNHMNQSPIEKEGNVYCVDRKNKYNISILHYGELSIRTFISFTSKKNEASERDYKNDYQRYSLFYNAVDKLLTESQEENKLYCPMCNPYGKANKKFCKDCSRIFNKLRKYINENSEKHFRQNLSRKFDKNLPKKEFYKKRLEALERTWQKELVKNGFTFVQNPYYKIISDNPKVKTEELIKIKDMFIKRFSIKR